MAIASIEQLVGAFCEAAGVQGPALSPDAHGTWAATIRVRGVDVVLQQFAGHSPDTVFLTVDLGRAPEEKAVAAWRVLMAANLYMTGESTPVFSRHPASGHAVLQFAYPLMEASAPDFHHRVAALAETACAWRRDHFLEEPEAAYGWAAQGFAGRLVLPQESLAGCAQFEALYIGVCHVLGQAPQPMPSASVPRGFPLRIQGVELSVLHSPESGHSAIILAQLGASEPATELDELVALMDLNFGLATGNRLARVSREPASGQLLLQHSFPLDGGTATQLLATGAELARLVTDWRSSVLKARSPGHATDEFSTQGGY